jgi:hypothetical protein
MCLNTSSSRGELLEVRKVPRPHLQKAVDRLEVVKPFFKYVRGFALTMFAAYVGQTTQNGAAQLTTWLVGVAEDSVLKSSWVFVYFLLVWVILKQNWKYCLRRFQEATTDLAVAGERDASLGGKVSSSETLSKIRRSSMMLFSLSHSQLPHEGRYLAISTKEPFLSSDLVADLTLNDVKELFRYSLECNMAGFDRSTFVSNMRRSARKAIDSIDIAAQASRGPGVKPSKTRDAWDYGEIDTLVFIAVVRIFAEWRSLRLVPDGYQRYAVGMNLARRDLVQNVGKMETSAHEWFHYHERCVVGASMSSPTLRQLLKHEIDLQIHTRLPRINNESAASGFLWIKRQVHYQTAVLANTVQVPMFFPTSKAAVTAAYMQVYDDYHGFFVKAIFQTSFEAAPSSQTILHFMNRPAITDEDFQTAPLSEDEDDDFFDSWVDFPMDDDANPPNAAEEWKEEPVPNPFEQFGRHIALEWTKIQGFVDQCRGVNINRHQSRNAIDVGSFQTQKVPISRQASRAAEDDIPSYMNIMQPFIKGLDRVIEEMNINDPSRV